MPKPILGLSFWVCLWFWSEEMTTRLLTGFYRRRHSAIDTRDSKHAIGQTMKIKENTSGSIFAEFFVIIT